MIMMTLLGHIICLVGLVYLISAEADNVQPLHAQNEPVQAENTGQRGSKFEDGQSQQAGKAGRNEQVINDGQMEDENMINVKDIYNYQNDDSGEVVNEMKEMPDEENVAIHLDHNSEQRDQNNIDDGHHEGSDYNLDLQNDNDPINIDGQQGMGENENFDHGLAHGDTDSHKMTDKEKDLPITTENDETESPQQHEERRGDLDHQPVYDDTIQQDQQHMKYEDQQQNSPEPNQYGEEQEDQQVHDSYAAKEDETRQYEEYPESQEEIYGEKQQGTQQQDLYEEQQEHFDYKQPEGMEQENEQYEQYEEKHEEQKQYEQNDELQTPNQPFDADQYHDDRASVDDAFQGDTYDVGDDFHHQADPAPNAEETPHVEEQYSEESHREQLILEPVIEDIPYDGKQEEQTQDTYYGEEIPVNDFGDASHEEHREYDTRDHVGDFEDHGSDAPQQEDQRMVDDEQYVEEFQPQTAQHPPDLVDPIPDEGPVEVEQILGEKYEDDGATYDQQFQEEVSDQHVYDNVEYIHKEPITGEEEFHQDPKEDEEHDAYRITEEEMEFEKKLKEQQSLEDEQEYQKETIQEDVEQEDSGTKENIKGNLQSQPNIVIFLASNVEVGDLGCYGNRTAVTPNIDSIAARGVLMSHQLTAGLTDTSSRAAFYTGRIPVRYGMSPTGVSDEIETVASKSGLPAEETTFAEILKSENYETALIGTWNLGMNCDSIEDRCHHPNMHGFGRFFGLPLLNKYSVPDSAPQNDYIKKPILIMALVFFICIILRKVLGLAAVLVIIISCLAFGGWSYFCYKNPQIWSNILMRDGDVTEQPVDWETLTGRIVSEARKFLNSQNREQHQPKLLVVSFPHIYPYLDTSKEFRGQKKQASRGDKLKELDWAVGELLRTLETLGMGADTLVYFTSTSHRAAPDLEILERQLVPGLAMWPGVLPREAVVGSVTSQLDVVPTLVHFAKGSLVKGRSYDGENIADTLVTRDGYDTPSRYIPQYCGDDLWSITFVAQGGQKAYIGYYFTAEWNIEPLYCSIPSTSRPQSSQKTFPPEKIYVIYKESRVMTSLSPVDGEYGEALESIQRSRRTHMARVEAGLNQFTWYKQSWHAYLQPYCTDGQLVCKDRTT